MRRVSILSYSYAAGDGRLDLDENGILGFMNPVIPF